MNTFLSHHGAPSKRVSLARVVVGAVVIALVGAASVAPVAAHCQVPCGIYDDEARIEAMLEDVATIDKAVKGIDELVAAKDAQSLNQAVRWINTKEQHASNIIETVALYFLTQKLKPAEGNDAAAKAHYLEVLADHHAVMRAAMKTKQTVSADAVAALKAAIEKMASHYTSTPPATAPASTQPTRSH